MILKINGTPVSEVLTVNEEGVNFNLDLHDMYDVIHTPLNVDLSFSDYNIVKGDLNMFNWTQPISDKLFNGIESVFDLLF